jgi:alpha-L-rhamnosidase
VAPGLSFAKTSFRSIHGLIATQWKHEGTNLTLTVTIPANTTARVWVPTSDPQAITEQGKPVAQVAGIQPAGNEAGAALFDIGSGTYEFHSTLK